MAENNKLFVNLLGSTSITYNGKTINDHTVRSKKFWLIVEYLITFRNRDISQAELIDLIYPEGKSENPGNALKTLMHRIRGELDELGYINSHEMIVQSRGTYAWNAKMNSVIDVEEFEALCNKGNAPGATDDERLDYYLSAIGVYKGDFLHKSSLDAWVVQYNVFYRSMYCETVHKAIDILKPKNEYQKIIEICERALRIDPYDEILYYNLIHSLVNMGELQEALTEYRKMSTLFFREFGINPSAEITKLYREIIKTSKKVETDLNAIKGNLNEDPAMIKGAFFCEFEIFKDIYRVELRAKPRTGETVFLGMMTLTTASGDVPSVKMLNSFMDKLKECIKISLRENDVFAQYSVSQFIMLLPLTTFENGEKAVNRILKLFVKHYPYCNLKILHSIIPLDARLK